jgi:hypothetical protein
VANTENTTTSVKELLDNAFTAQNKALETLGFICKCLEKGSALDELEIDGLNNILADVQRCIDEAADVTDRAITQIEVQESDAR